MSRAFFIAKYPSIEASWRTYRLLVVDPVARTARLDDRERAEFAAHAELAFKAGAAVLFRGMLNMLDPGEDATEADLGKMDAINAEIEKFESTFDAEVLKRQHAGRPQ